MLILESSCHDQNLFFKNIENKITRAPLKECLKSNEIVLVLNPTKEVLSSLTEWSIRTLIVSEYVEEFYLEFIKEKSVLETIVFDDLDCLFLNNAGIKKVKKAVPFIAKSSNKKLEIIACITDLRYIKEKEIGIMNSLSGIIEVYYAGSKEIHSRESFENLLSINYSNIRMSADLKTNIENCYYSKFLLDFNYKKTIPRASLVSTMSGSVPFLFCQRYYKWLPAELQSQNLQLIKDIICSPALQEEMLKRQKELLEKYFSNSESLDGAISNWF